MGARPSQFGLFGGAPEKPRTYYQSTPACGHAAQPGTGPRGETCGTCANCRIHAVRSGKRYYKCGLQIRAWTHGRGSDVLKSSPACEHWRAGAPRFTTAWIRRAR